MSILQGLTRDSHSRAALEKGRHSKQLRDRAHALGPHDSPVRVRFFFVS